MDINPSMDTEESSIEIEIFEEADVPQDMKIMTSKSVVMFLTSQMTSLGTQIDGLKKQVDTTMDNCCDKINKVQQELACLNANFQKAICTANVEMTDMNNRVSFFHTNLDQ
jgi:hypothetical protein